MAIPTASAIIYQAAAAEVVLKTVPTKFNINSNFLADVELIKNTCAQAHRVAVNCAIASYACTCKRNKVPNTIRIVAINQIAKIEENLLLCVPILETLITSFSPNTGNFCTKTDTRSKPLTDSYRSLRIRTEAFQRALRETQAVFCRSIESSPLSTALYKPVAPERVGSNAVLLCNVCILSHYCH